MRAADEEKMRVKGALCHKRVLKLPTKIVNEMLNKKTKFKPLVAICIVYNVR